MTFTAFITDSHNDTKLYEIRKQIMGIKPQNDDDGSDSEDDDDDDDEDNDDEDEPLAPGQQKKRQQSDILQALIDKHWTGVDCRPKSTDGSCMLDFLEASISEFDFGSRNKKSGRYSWSEQNYEDLKDILTKLQYICMYFQRNDSESIRNFYVNINNIAKEYFTHKYKGEHNGPLGDNIVEKYWRNIIKADRAVVIQLMKKKRLLKNSVLKKYMKFDMK